MLLKFSSTELIFVMLSSRPGVLELRSGDARCVPRFGLCPFGFRGFADLLRVVDREQQEITEGMAPVIALPRQRAIPIRALRQPEACGGVSKVDRPVFYALVTAHQANLGHRPHRICLYGQDLRVRGVNPRATLQTHGKGLAANAIDEHCAFTVASLLEMNHPSGFAALGSAAFARKFIFLLVMRM